MNSPNQLTIHFSQILPFAHDLCLNFEKYGDQKHLKSCEKRHRFVEEDQPEWCATARSSIRFRIIHAYSPVHYMVEIYQQKKYDQWEFVDTINVEVFLSNFAPRSPDKYGPKEFQRIFENIFGERFECKYEAKVLLKSKEIWFVYEMQRSAERFSQFLHDLFPRSDDVKNILERMIGDFEQEK